MRLTQLFPLTGLKRFGAGTLEHSAQMELKAAYEQHEQERAAAAAAPPPPAAEDDAVLLSTTAMIGPVEQDVVVEVQRFKIEKS